MPDSVAPPVEVVARVLELAARARPRCGTSVVIGIDGPSGSGKSTLAAAVCARLECPVVHMDDLFPGWNGLAQAADLLAEQVLRPFASGEDAHYRSWDWEASRWGSVQAVSWAPVLVVEGCASTVAPASAFIAVRVWVEADATVRMTRGIERDGEAFRPHWERWAAQEQAMFAADGTRARADLIVPT